MGSIHMWHGLQKGPVLETFNQIVNEWNMGHPNSKVELKAYTDYGTPVNEALEKPENEQPNLVLAPEYMTSTMFKALSNKKVMPINKILKEEELKDIAEIVKRTFGDKNGDLVSLPFNPSCGVIFTNKDMLKAAMYDPDYVPKSIEELEQVCKTVKVGYTCAWPPAYLIEIPAAQQDLALVLPDNGKQGYGDYQLSQSWLIKHLLDIRRQQKEGIFIYGGKTNESALQPFIDRKVVFFMQGSTHYSLLQQKAKESKQPFEVGCGPLPTLVHGQKEKYAFPLGGAAIWVLNNEQTSKMIDGVREFMSYLASKKVQERWHQETAYVPVSKTLPQTLEGYYKDHPLHKAVVAQTIEATLGKYSFGIGTSNYASARKELFELIEKILDEKTKDEDVEKLLKEFDKKYSTGSDGKVSKQ